MECGGPNKIQESELGRLPYCFSHSALQLLSGSSRYHVLSHALSDASHSRPEELVCAVVVAIAILAPEAAASARALKLELDPDPQKSLRCPFKPWQEESAHPTGPKGRSLDWASEETSYKVKPLHGCVPPLPFQKQLNNRQLAESQNGQHGTLQMVSVKQSTTGTRAIQQPMFKPWRTSS